MKCLALVSTLSILLMSASAANAFTVSAATGISGTGGAFCDNSDTASSGSIVFACSSSDLTTAPGAFHYNSGSAYARAEVGNLGISVSAKSRTVGGGVTGSISARATASVYDNISVGIPAGWLSIPLDILGIMTASSERIDSVGPGAGNSAQIGVYLPGGSLSVFNGGAALQPYTVGDRTFVEWITSSEGTSAGIVSLLLPIIDGATWYSLTMTATASCASAAIYGESSGDGPLPLLPGDCSSAAEFQNSVRFLRATVLDELFQPVDGVTVTSESGFDYLTGVQPHRVPSVPIPPSLLLVCTAIASLFSASVWQRIASMKR